MFIIIFRPLSTNQASL